MWSEFRVPNSIRSAVLGRLYVSERYSVTVRVTGAVVVDGGRCGSLVPQ